MLIETKAVVQMALLFGSTWMVNSIVFCAVLTMILVANLFVLAVRPRSLTPFYVGLVLSLGTGVLSQGWSSRRVPGRNADQSSVQMCGTIGESISTALSSTSCTIARSAGVFASNRPSSFRSSMTAAMAVLKV